MSGCWITVPGKGPIEVGGEIMMLCLEAPRRAMCSGEADAAVLRTSWSRHPRRTEVQLASRLLRPDGVCDRQPGQVLIIIDTAQPGGEGFGREAVAVDERAIGLIEYLA